MTTRNGYLRRSALGVFTLLGLALAGCAAPGGQPGPGSVIQGAKGHALDENLNGFLAQSPAGSVISLAESPWGANVDVVADEPYYAASGRECRKLQVMAASGTVRQAVACETASGWESRRLITEAASARGTR